MTAVRPMRIALLTHSINPRGGVMHVIHLAEALVDRGHHVVVHAPDPQSRGLFRSIRCPFRPIPSTACAGPLVELVRQRIAEYVDFFQTASSQPFDIYHAHDGISGSALAALRHSGHISDFVRTVHHLDDFDDQNLTRWQDQSITEAQQVLCVSRLWESELLRRYRISAEQVTNGVDLDRFTIIADDRDQAARAHFGITKSGPVFLSVGGIEKRKNTTRLLEAFIRVHRRNPDAQLIIAGGTSLLDHSSYRKCFDEMLSASGLSVGRDCILTGPVADEMMPALMRVADALVFPSLTEGFGLVVLEAMASGTPVVVSKIEPFTQYLEEPDCAWADPLDVDSIAAAMLRACDPAAAADFRQRGFEVAQRYPWSRSAQTHETIYNQLTRESRDAGNAFSSSMA